jgi:hypothetical protein
MNKAFLFFALICASFSIHAQVTYRIDKVSDSCFYLVEITPQTPSQENPKGLPVEFPQRFNTKEQLAFYVQNLRKQAEEYRRIAADYTAKAPRTEKAADSIEVLVKTDPSLNPKPIVVTPNPPKPTPKKKKKE